MANQNQPRNQPAQPDTGEDPDPDEPGIDDAERQRRLDARERRQTQG